MKVPCDRVAAQDQIRAEAKRLIRHSPCFVLSAIDLETGEVKTAWISLAEVPAATRAVHEVAQAHAAKILADLDDE
jgi:hypothetical protein